MNDQKSKSVIVAGAGISGVCLALQIAESGCPVYLVEKSPHIGGMLSRLDHQFPTNGCGMCRMLPMQNRIHTVQTCLRKGLFHTNITVLPLTEIRSVTGVPGNLTVSVIQTVHGVDPDKCMACGKCDVVCPVVIPDEFNCQLSQTKAIYAPLPHQYPAKRIIDLLSCTRCGECLKVCPTHAISLDRYEKSFDIPQVAGIILSPGIDIYPPETTDLYGYGKYPNVVTTTAFERVLSSTGPFAGNPVRPSDKAPIRNVAWIHCVGSRNITIGADYCSSVCCMIALKQAVLFHEKQEGQTTLFYMDMRTFGRDYQRYRDKAESQYGVRFIRCRVHSIEPANDTGDLIVRYVTPSGTIEHSIFDMVVLAVGQASTQLLPDYARQDGVWLIRDGREWKDIAESVIGAYTTASQVIRQLKHQGLIPTKQNSTSIPMLPIFQQKPVVQVILFEDDAPHVSWNAVADAILQLPGKVKLIRLSSILNPANWESIEQEIMSGKANRWVMVGCYPYPIGSHIKKLSMKTGVPETLIEVADVHLILQNEKEPANSVKAIVRQIEMSIAQVQMRRIPLKISLSLNQTVMIIGAGAAGLSAALTLADLGTHVVVVEKSDRLGGNLAACKMSELKQAVDKLVHDTSNHPKIKILTHSEVTGSKGRGGKFTSIVKDKDGNHQTIYHGAVVIATGGRPGSTLAYGLGTHERIVSQFDFEKIIYDVAFSNQELRQVVMIQCAGCREEPKNYCSRICCQKSLIHALRIKEVHPHAEIIIFYRDMMTYGQSEKIYTEARRKGVLFFPYERHQPPRVHIEQGAPTVTGVDPVFHTHVTVQPDWISLAVGVEPHPIHSLVNLFHVQTTSDGFILEADIKWRPVDTEQVGVFTAGLARCPVRGDEAIKQGEAAAIRAWTYLQNDSQVIQTAYPLAIVRHTLCTRCEACISVCPYQARYRDEELNQIIVDVLACQGCGACAVACPNSATVIGNFEDGCVMEMMDIVTGD